MIDFYLDPNFKIKDVSVLGDLNNNVNKDIKYHGSHIASTIASELYGVLPGVQLKFVQVDLDTGRTEKEQEGMASTLAYYLSIIPNAKALTHDKMRTIVRLFRKNDLSGQIKRDKQRRDPNFTLILNDNGNDGFEGIAVEDLIRRKTKTLNNCCNMIAHTRTKKILLIFTFDCLTLCPGRLGTIIWSIPLFIFSSILLHLDR